MRGFGPSSPCLPRHPGWALGMALLLSVPAAAQVNVLTSRYNPARTGANLAETRLVPANVNVGQFGKRWSYAVDGLVFAQPLYASGVSLPGLGIHNVVYVATMNDTVYAFDADANLLLWSVSVAPATAGVTPVPIADITGSNTGNIVGNVGIEGTPVIDPASQTLYLVARTKEPGPVYVQRLHALDMTTGAEKFGGPVALGGAVPGFATDGAAGKVAFTPKMPHQRAGLALANGWVVVAWASHNDIEPFHGWLMAYNAATLQPAAIYNTTPNGLGGGIWQAGTAPAVDAAGNVYVGTGNGDWDGSANFGDSYLKLSTGGSLALLDWFTPDNQAALNTDDFDLGSAGPMLIPGTSLMLGASKAGYFYLIDTRSLGHQQPGNTQISQVLQASVSEIRPGPVFWSDPALGPLIYVWGQNDVLRVYHFNGATIDPIPVALGGLTEPNPGAVLALSANGSLTGTGILWASMPVSQSAGTGVVPGVLRAYDASNPATELWDSLQNRARDDLLTFAKFNPPTVANGKVYAASFSNAVMVYGPLADAPRFVEAPVPQQVAGGGRATFTALAGGAPAPNYQWLRNGSPLAGATDPVLVIAAATSADAGNYACVATNASGAAVSMAAALTVSAAPGTRPGLSR